MRAGAKITNAAIKHSDDIVDAAQGIAWLADRAADTARAAAGSSDEAAEAARVTMKPTDSNDNIVQDSKQMSIGL